MATARSDSVATEHTEVPQLAELVNQEAGLVMPRPPNSNARPGSSQDQVVNVRTVFEPPLRQIYDHRISYGSSNSIATELATEPCLIVRGKHIWSEFLLGGRTEQCKHGGITRQTLGRGHTMRTQCYQDWDQTRVPARDQDCITILRKGSPKSYIQA